MPVCDQDPVIGRYHDGELLAADRPAFEAHLASCPACSAELARLRAMTGRFQSAPRPTLSLNDKADLRQMMAAAAEEAGAEARRITRPLRVARWLTAAAAVVFLISMSQVILSNFHSGTGGNPRVQPTHDPVQPPNPSPVPDPASKPAERTPAGPQAEAA